MTGDDRARYDAALRRARESAFASGEFVGQESFMTATEIQALALQAGVGPDMKVLDVCCGVAGPGRLIAHSFGCDYLGVDANPRAITLARERAGALPCRFAVAHVPPLPDGPFDVVMLLETMLAFQDKDAVVTAVRRVLEVGGRFAFTLEEGTALTAAERAVMPTADTVWPAPYDEINAALKRGGLVVSWQEDHSATHRATAQALVDAFVADATQIAAQIGRPALDELLAAHRLWTDWLGTGRIRKLAVVAQRV